jgi:hypothetical protein
MKYLPLVLLLSGCANFGGGAYENMSAEQIAALAKMKDANVACVIVNSPWGRGVTVFANVDKDVIQKGQVVIDTDCKVTITNEKPGAAKPSP